MDVNKMIWGNMIIYCLWPGKLQIPILIIFLLPVLLWFGLED